MWFCRVAGLPALFMLPTLFMLLAACGFQPLHGVAQGVRHGRILVAPTGPDQAGPDIARLLDGRKPRKRILVPGRIVNVVL